MHVFVYEWVTGGGLLTHEGPLPNSLLVEGLAMVQAVAADFAAVSNTKVSLLQDLRVVQISTPGTDRISVGSVSEHNEVFAQLCRSADAVLLIAPEIDGVLSHAVAEAEAHQASLISPDSAFVAVTSDKHETAQRLAAAGVPVPDGHRLEEDDSLPQGQVYPAVIKPTDGAGSEAVYVLTGPQDAPPRVGPQRLEPLLPGITASVSLLTGPAGIWPLPPCRQRLSLDGRLRYLGGTTELAAGLASRATQLAVQAVEALPTARGYVGVDLVLGADPRGAEDYVIEVNPRLTTSYVGLRFASWRNLAHEMLAVAKGQDTTLDFDPQPLEFSPDGAVSYLEEGTA